MPPPGKTIRLGSRAKADLRLQLRDPQLSPAWLAGRLGAPLQITDKFVSTPLPQVMQLVPSNPSRILAETAEAYINVVTIPEGDLVRSEEVEISKAPYATTEPAVEGLPHPLTGKIIPYDEIDLETIKGIVAELRRHYIHKVDEMVRRYHDGQDGKVLSAEIIRDAKTAEAKRVRDSMEAIIKWYAEKIGNPGFSLGIRHRYSRPLRRYAHSEVFFRHDLMETFEAAVHPYALPLATLITDTLVILGRPEHNMDIGVEMKFASGDTVLDNSPYIDFTALEQIVEELLWNALKYAMRLVRIDWDAEKSTLVIANDGPPIPSDRDIFAPGVRGDHPEIEGTGYGLSNAREDAEAQGWDLNYEYRDGLHTFTLGIRPKEGAVDPVQLSKIFATELPFHISSPEQVGKTLNSHLWHLPDNQDRFRYLERLASDIIQDKKPDEKHLAIIHLLATRAFEILKETEDRHFAITVLNLWVGVLDRVGKPEMAEEFRAEAEEVRRVGKASGLIED